MKHHRDDVHYKLAWENNWFSTATYGAVIICRFAIFLEKKKIIKTMFLSSFCCLFFFFFGVLRHIQCVLYLNFDKLLSFLTLCTIYDEPFSVDRQKNVINISWKIVTRNVVHSYDVHFKRL